MGANKQSSDYYAEYNLLVIRFEGEYTSESFLAEVVPMIQGLYPFLSGDKRPLRLLDLRKTFVHVRLEGVHDVVDSFSDLNKQAPNAKAAFLAESDMMFGVIRQYEQFSPDSTVERAVFRDPKEALGWLGIDPKLAEELGLSPPE